MATPKLHPFADNLSDQNQGLVYETARELEDTAKQDNERHRTCWIDQHEHEPANPIDPNYCNR